MKIRITRDTKIPLVEKGRVFYVQGVSTTGDGETVYLGICAGDCEVIEREPE